MDSLYHVLGVDERASDREVRRAYRRQVLVHHPDKGGSAESFRMLQLAFETLSSPLRRRSYDDHFALYRQRTSPTSSPQQRSVPTVRPKRKSTVPAHRKPAPEPSTSEPLGAGVPPKKRDSGGHRPRALLLRTLRRLYFLLGSQPREVRQEVVDQLSPSLQKELTNFIVHQKARSTGTPYFASVSVAAVAAGKSRVWLCGAAR